MQLIQRFTTHRLLAERLQFKHLHELYRMHQDPQVRSLFLVGWMERSGTQHMILPINNLQS